MAFQKLRAAPRSENRIVKRGKKTEVIKKKTFRQEYNCVSVAFTIFEGFLNTNFIYPLKLTHTHTHIE